jgi:hypothetical protein
MTQLTAPQNVLPTPWIDRLFARFSVLYGKHWADMWSDVPLADVKDAWQTELGGCTGDQIREALKNVGKFPPTLPEFLALCKPPVKTPAHQAYLPAPRTKFDDIDPKVRVAISEFKTLGRKRDPKDWARRILSEADAGTYRLQYGIDCAKEALGIVKH